jgi:hypothetical protein
MLTRVTVGQVRFNLAGLYADPRGVAMGKELLLRFATLDRLVAFLRLWSAERSPDEVWSSLSVIYARPPGAGREVFARMTHPGGEVGDLVANTARLAGGAPHTGSGRHFVPMRETRAPLGYDVVSVPHDEGDFCLVSTEGVTSFRQEGVLAFERLLLRLQLRRHLGGIGAALRQNAGDPVVVSARRGLAPMFMQLLFREGVAARAAIVDSKAGGPFAAGATTWLFHIPDLPPRLAGLCARTPGLGLFVPVLEDVFVAAGWQHPIHLGGARAALRGDRLLLLQASPQPPMEIAPKPHFVALEDLIAIELGAGARDVPLPPIKAAEAGNAAEAPGGRAGEALVVPLQLEPLAGGPVRVRATLVPWAQAAWVRRLLFALPSVALRSHRVAFVESGLLIVAPDRLDGLPFGQPLEEPHPGLFVPVGMRLRPALSPELLAERLGISDGTICVFPARDAPPFRIAAAAFEALERKALSRADVPWATAPATRAAPMLAADPSAVPEIENDPLGVLPLWGWRP